MHISIRTRRLNIRPRLRAQIENYLRKRFETDQGQVAKATLYISATPLAGGYAGYECRLVLLTPRVGKLVVHSIEPRLTQAVRQVARRGRTLLRERRKRRRGHARSATTRFAELELV